MQWPMSLVLFEDKVTHSPNRKFKSMAQMKERVASCDPRSERSTSVGFEALVGGDVLAHLTEECESLFYRMCDGNHDTTSIAMKASLLYLEEDKETWVTSNDISEFLKGACANVSLIHVYIMYLVENFISLFDNSKIRFLCPQRISGVEVKRDVT